MSRKISQSTVSRVQGVLAGSTPFEPKSDNLMADEARVFLVINAGKLFSLGSVVERDIVGKALPDDYLESILEALRSVATRKEILERNAGSKFIGVMYFGKFAPPEIRKHLSRAWRQFKDEVSSVASLEIAAKFFDAGQHVVLNSNRAIFHDIAGLIPSNHDNVASKSKGDMTHRQPIGDLSKAFLGTTELNLADESLAGLRNIIEEQFDELQQAAYREVVGAVLTPLDAIERLAELTPPYQSIQCVEHFIHLLSFPSPFKFSSIEQVRNVVNGLMNARNGSQNVASIRIGPGTPIQEGRDVRLTWSEPVSAYPCGRMIAETTSAPFKRCSRSSMIPLSVLPYSLKAT